MEYQLDYDKPKKKTQSNRYVARVIDNVSNDPAPVMAY